MKRLIASFFTIILPFISVAQEIDRQSLIKEAKKGNVGAMCQLGKSYLTSGDDTLYPEAYKWLSRASDEGNPQAKSMIAYMIKNKLVDMPMHEAFHYASEATDNNDALGWWLLAQMQTDPSAAMGYVEKAFHLDYPLAKLLLAKLYATGSEEFQIVKDEARSQELLRGCADGGNQDAAALYGIGLLRQGSSQAFQ